MGTQQIFMVIVSVLIVGLAIAVAISSTDNMAVTTNRSSVTGDLVGIYGRAMEYWLTPASHGGGGRESWSPDGAQELGPWLGYEGYQKDGDAHIFSTGNGSYHITIEDDNTLTVIGSGNEIGYDPSYASSGAGEHGQLEYRMVIDPHQSNYQIELLN
jgi:hypothetical protein